MSENDNDPRPGEFTDPTASPDWTAPQSADRSQSTPPASEPPRAAPTEHIPQGSDTDAYGADPSDAGADAAASDASTADAPPSPQAPSYDAPYVQPRGDSNPYAGSSAQPTNPYAATPPPPPHDPYGAPQPYYDPYAAGGAPPQQGGYPAYQAPGQWQAPPAAYGAPPPQNTSALVLTILSGLGVVACCQVFMIGSLILGIMGLTKNATDPEGSRRLTKWGWVVFAISLALSVIAATAFIAFGMSGAFDGSGGYSDSDFTY